MSLLSSLAKLLDFNKPNPIAPVISDGAHPQQKLGVSRASSVMNQLQSGSLTGESVQGAIQQPQITQNTHVQQGGYAQLPQNSDYNQQSEQPGVRLNNLNYLAYQRGGPGFNYTSPNGMNFYQPSYSGHGLIPSSFVVPQPNLPNKPFQELPRL